MILKNRSFVPRHVGTEREGASWERSEPITSIGFHSILSSFGKGELCVANSVAIKSCLRTYPVHLKNGNSFIAHVFRFKD